MERRSNRPTNNPSTTSGGTVVDARMSLAVWLRAGRAQKGMSLESVAKVTKIQPRILERLEAGKLDGLPAEVFVRGFIRSFARCVGLDEAEALQRYTAAAGASQTPSASARAFVESMSELAPASARAAKDLAAGS
ncbi:MAG: helix-turn-helix domain-containing protein, partial [Kofleriaceae bacterium]|nr:helix-turn-helix domain-containing protein [Kofleriaceae bacterium]